MHVGTVASVLLMGPVADFINRKFVSRLMAGQESLLDNKTDESTKIPNMSVQDAAGR